MNKLITIYEYDNLTTSNDDFDEVKMKALLRLNELHGGLYLDGLSNGVRFNQYVGIIQVDGLTIEILPKADRDEGDPRWRQILLDMLKRTGKLKATSLGAANVKRKNLNLLEIYFELFLNEILILQRLGLIKKYRKETKNVNALKGKLDFTGHIRHNLIHQERFYTTHQVYDKNHKLHQILYVALDIVKQFSKGTRLDDFCNRVLFDFPQVQLIKVTEQLFSGLHLDRKSASYTHALELARLIILNYSPDISAGRERMISLLFDMNKLWEEYILNELRKIQDREQFVVEGQAEKDFWGSNYLKPDIVITKGGKKYIIDTKWKRPGDVPSISDLRQMYTYARFWKAEKVMLLYPGNNKKKFKEFLTDDFHIPKDEVEQIKHQCRMGFVSVLDTNNLEPVLDENIGYKILEELEIL